MSDLTITHAGISTTKSSGAEVLTAEKKLTQMKVDIVEITPSTTTNACSLSEIIFDNEKISNVVATKGGSCVLQSIVLVDDDDHGVPIDLVFFNKSSSLGTEGSPITVADGAVPDAILGVVRITDYLDGVAWKAGHKQNIGMVLKADADSRDISVAAINKNPSAKTWTASGLLLKLGVIQD